MIKLRHKVKSRASTNNRACVANRSKASLDLLATQRKVRAPETSALNFVRKERHFSIQKLFTQ